MESLLIKQDLSLTLKGKAKKPVGMIDEDCEKLDKKARATIFLSLSNNVLFNVTSDATTKKGLQNRVNSPQTATHVAGNFGSVYSQLAGQPTWWSSTPPQLARCVLSSPHPPPCQPAQSCASPHSSRDLPMLQASLDPPTASFPSPQALSHELPASLPPPGPSLLSSLHPHVPMGLVPPTQAPSYALLAHSHATVFAPPRPLHSPNDKGSLPPSCIETVDGDVAAPSCRPSSLPLNPTQVEQDASAGPHARDLSVSNVDKFP
ncbi:uncharacterized protein LOC131871322 [Cryptomeria japonica]|uniref:uncharacterized protein LOC131871322 n=1 Tax=Cryptomeria japonica TaxID=3369 RepID=UPI0027DAB2F1|nr:uncharacterized protein LOC131871322 [Cryptomeria japonica]